MKDWEVISSEKKELFQYKILKFSILNVTHLKSYYMKTDFQRGLRGRHQRIYQLKPN